MKAGLSVAVGLCVALLGPTSSALGARAPTPEELKSMEASASSQFDKASSQRLEVELTEARVSTVEPEWAAAEEAYRENPKQSFAHGFAIFARAGSESFWEPAIFPTTRCDAGFGLPISIAAQYDLALPHCPLAGATLGDATFVQDSGGNFKSEPRAITLTVGRIQVRIVDLRRWDDWAVNRGAEASTEGLLSETLSNGGGPKRRRVFVELQGYGHCGGRLVFRRIQWRSAGTPHIKRRVSALPCLWGA